MSDLFRGALPPAPKSKMDVVRVTSSESHTFIVFSRSFFGQFVHWWGNRTHECLSQKKMTCEGCQRGWPVKFKAYLHVRRLSADWEGFVELTDTAARLIEAQVPEGSNLRGCKIRIGRTKGGAKGRYIIEVYESRLPEDQLREEKDPYATLRQLAKPGEYVYN